MTGYRVSGLIYAAIGIIVFLALLAGCSDKSPKLFCCEDPDSEEYTDTGLTMNEVIKGLEKQKLDYKYDEKEKILLFKNKNEENWVRIYFKDHASGLTAYKARQSPNKMDVGINIPENILPPRGEFVMNPCKLLKLIVKK